MSLSTHVLDTARGRPAAGVALSLAHWTGTTWATVFDTRTDADGRAAGLPLAGEGSYRLRFSTAEYFAEYEEPSLYPYIDIVFAVASAGDRYHIPLLLAANGYTTYRGS